MHSSSTTNQAMKQRLQSMIEIAAGWSIKDALSNLPELKNQTN